MKQNKGRYTALVTSCLQTAFSDTLLKKIKERHKGREDVEVK